MLSRIFLVLLLTFVQLILGVMFAVICGWLIGRRLAVIRGLGWVLVGVLVIGYISGSVIGFEYLSDGDWTYVPAILANIFLLFSTLVIARSCNQKRRQGVAINVEEIFRF